MKYDWLQVGEWLNRYRSQGKAYYWNNILVLKTVLKELGQLYYKITLLFSTGSKL